jgi:3-deoxy-D-manno-octulosonic-acid transferase
MAHRLYTLLLWLALPVVVIRLGLRAARSPGYRGRISERFGSGKSDKQFCDVWVHAVSVGEVNAATPLVQRLLDEKSDLDILITTMTPTGAQQVVDTFGNKVRHRFAPYDYPFAIRRFIDHFSPKLLILMETEIWPNMIRLCHHQGIPVVMANVRLSARSARGYRSVLFLVREGLNKVSLFATQSEADRQNLLSLGVAKSKTHRTGSMKFEIKMPASVNEVAHAVRRDWSPNRPVVVAGSTHEGEEDLLLRAFQSLLNDFPDLLLVIAPRHPERFESVVKLVARQGFKASRRTRQSGALDASVQIQIADTMGELPVLYGAADIAVVGGSLIPIRGIGGHNILEPCAVGVPVIFGRNMGNFLEISEIALRAGAGFQVSDEAALITQLRGLLDDAPLRDSVGEAGRMMVEQNAGATQKTCDLILPFFAPR